LTLLDNEIVMPVDAENEASKTSFLMQYTQLSEGQSIWLYLLKQLNAPSIQYYIQTR
jgi:hypothetical protein